jgi:hypothetical protein
VDVPIQLHISVRSDFFLNVFYVVDKKELHVNILSLYLLASFKSLCNSMYSTFSDFNKMAFFLVKHKP